MSQLKFNKGVIESIATDRKVGYVLKIRILNSDIETDARVLDLRYAPCSILMDFEDPLVLEPAIDYSNIFDPDREDFEDANTDSED